MVPHTFPPPQLQSRHGTFLGSIWDVLLLAQAQLQPPLVAPPSIRCLCLCPAGTTWAGVCGPYQAVCSHRKLALPEGSLPAREMGPVTLGRHRAHGVTHPCRQCREAWAVLLHVSPISTALPVAMQWLFHCQPLLVQYAEGISHL